MKVTAPGCINASILLAWAFAAWVILTCCGGCVCKVDREGAYVGVGWKQAVDWVKEKNDERRHNE